MPTSEAEIQQNIVQTVAAAVGIASSQAWDQSGNRYADLPVVITRHARSLRLDENSDGSEDWRTWFHLHVMIDDDPAQDPRDTDEILAALVAEIVRVLYTDRTRGTLAIDSDHLEAMSIEPVEGQRFADRVLVFAVNWRRREGTGPPPIYIPPTAPGSWEYFDLTGQSGTTYELDADALGDLWVFLTGSHLSKREDAGPLNANEWRLTGRTLEIGLYKRVGEALIVRFQRA